MLFVGKPPTSPLGQRSDVGCLAQHLAIYVFFCLESRILQTSEGRTSQERRECPFFLSETLRKVKDFSNCYVYNGLR